MGVTVIMPSLSIPTPQHISMPAAIWSDTQTLPSARRVSQREKHHTPAVAPGTPVITPCSSGISISPSNRLRGLPEEFRINVARRRKLLNVLSLECGS